MDAALNKKLDKKHRKGIESKKSLYGRMFILPWCIGMILFFFVPLAQSFIYSVSYVSVEPGMMYTEWAGLIHYDEIFNLDPDYTTNLTYSLGVFFRSLPIVVIVSLMLALVLNQKFAGRTFFRAIFFLPVIIATGVVMTNLSYTFGGVGQIINLSTDTTNVYSQSTSGGMDFTAILANLNLPEDLTIEMSSLITNIFNTLWSCGIPVILFVAGLQTIPEQLYEASRVEGATKWEEFWYITFPMLSQTLLLVIVFTFIELLTQGNNRVLTQAYNLMSNMTYDISAAMLWAFFAIVAGAIGAVILLYNKLLLKRWN